MGTPKIPASKELEGADAALRRAAQTAKRLAELNGTPYVVTETSASKQRQEYPNNADKKITCGALCVLIFAVVLGRNF